MTKNEASQCNEFSIENPCNLQKVLKTQTEKNCILFQKVKQTICQKIAKVARISSALMDIAL